MNLKKKKFNQKIWTSAWIIYYAAYLYFCACAQFWVSFHLWNDSKNGSKAMHQYFLHFVMIFILFAIIITKKYCVKELLSCTYFFLRCILCRENTSTYKECISEKLTNKIVRISYFGFFLFNRAVRQDLNDKHFKICICILANSCGAFILPN